MQCPQQQLHHSSPPPCGGLSISRGKRQTEGGAFQLARTHADALLLEHAAPRITNALAAEQGQNAVITSLRFPPVSPELRASLCGCFGSLRLLLARFYHPLFGRNFPTACLFWPYPPRSSDHRCHFFFRWHNFSWFSQLSSQAVERNCRCGCPAVIFSSPSFVSCTHWRKRRVGDDSFIIISA